MSKQRFSMTGISEPKFAQAHLCEPILRLLPEWFGIEAAIVHYVYEIDQLPTLLAYNQAQVAGFLSIKQHSEFAAEIYVMAVHPKFHRQGIGHQLVEVAEEKLRKQGIEYLQVKTLSASHPDQYYARTRAFYRSVGFRPLEEFPELWKGIPCLQMVKCL
ncbi:GNAT family N-acetyltransferase [Pseudanabaenaceae cyanobacterium LEGE 13415]|nr:GNAT family N-acetyltransferase [Pseudanabaenaceae cyanobacterium LEGE 13415]